VELTGLITRLSLEEKKQIIFDHEAKMGRQLALMVLEKPEPPFWASFIPMVFVFYAQKLKQYSSGLNDFVENYLSPRRDAIEAAIVATIADSIVDCAKLLEKAGDMPHPARQLYLKWITLLTDHYMLLLCSHGDCHEALARNGYKNKTNYQSICDSFIEAERAFNLALLPGIDGEAQDILEVVQKMNMCIADLHHHDAEKIFPLEAHPSNLKPKS
jgi:hypothetical protein